MPLAEARVLSTDNGDGTATMTVTFAEDDHKFDVWRDGSNAYVEYQETLSWRGEVRVADPDDDVYKSLMMSDEMTELLEGWNVRGVKRAKEPAA